MTQRLLLTNDLDGKPAAYLIDMDKFRRPMFEMMPMTIAPPPSRPFAFDVFNRDFAPQVMNPLSVVVNTIDTGDDFEFFYLFPLGKRAYVRKPKTKKRKDRSCVS